MGQGFENEEQAKEAMSAITECFEHAHKTGNPALALKASRAWETLMRVSDERRLQLNMSMQSASLLAKGLGLAVVGIKTVDMVLKKELRGKEVDVDALRKCVEVLDKLREAETAIAEKGLSVTEHYEKETAAMERAYLAKDKSDVVKGAADFLRGL